MKPVTVPLCVCLDGALSPIQSFDEQVLGACRHAPGSLFTLVAWRLRGRAFFRARVREWARFDDAVIPVDPAVSQWLGAQRAAGRQLVLVAALPRGAAESLAHRLGLFDAVRSADDAADGDPTASLAAHFGDGGFDLVAGPGVDPGVWRAARRAYVVGDAHRVIRMRGPADTEALAQAGRPGWRGWVRALRLHQWVKNVLVFIPALLAHRIAEPAVLVTSVLAFLAFGLCASSVYVVNDLLDLASDRRHPRKRARPFAAGTLSVRAGLVSAATCLAAAVAVAASVGAAFGVVLSAYYALTWAYSLWLKRAPLIDVMTLAGLYTLRIIAGAAATMIEPSFWLLAFSIFIFLSLGTVKRFTELDAGRAAGSEGGHGRGYSSEDLSLLMSLGTAAGYCAVVVMALYINSPDSQALYKHHKVLWLVCPLMLYWISRSWLLTSRGQMHDDPVVFAIRDRVSLGVLAIVAAVVYAAL